MTAMRGDRGTQLAARRGVAREQRQVAVRRAAGDDLDRAALLETAEALHQVPARGAHEGFRARAVEALPARRQLGERAFARAREPGAVLGGGERLLLEVGDELALELGVSELLAQHRREAERHAQRAA